MPEIARYFARDFVRIAHGDRRVYDCFQIIILNSKYYDKARKALYDESVSSTHKSIDPPRPFDVAGLVGTLTCDTVTVIIMIKTF